VDEQAALPIPNGWFAVEVSEGVPPGALRAVRYFDRDWVVFRTESGEAAVFGAFCPHLGAHFGHGGRVEGERLRCPFHGWAFGTSGVCEAIPYAKRVPPGASAQALPVIERNGFIFAWWDAAGRDPWFEIPEVPEASSEDWSSPDRYEWVIGAHGQELGENGVDQAHFHFVHGTRNVPVTEASEDGPYRHAFSPIRVSTPRGEVAGGIESRMAGMGFAATRFTGICETLELATTTPIDAEHVHVRYAFVQPKVDGRDPVGGVAAAIIRDIVKQTDEDVPIWEHKTYRSKPALCDGDGPISEYRRWCRQFYPEPSRKRGGSAVVEEGLGAGDR
jgi:phenylpropionate dioxygenase-like ring-hydroxylating dioxygenase large terminal subunit